MSSNLSANRSRLADLIYEMKHFSEESLRFQFHERYGDRPIDGRQSLRSYLRELMQFGILEYHAGFYKVVKNAKVGINRTAAHQRDRKRLRAALESRRFYRAWAESSAKMHAQDALESSDARNRDRKRLRRVLGMGKQKRGWAALWKISAKMNRGWMKWWYDLAFEQKGMRLKVQRWSAAWKAAAKHWRVEANKLYGMYAELIAERDELKRRLEEARGVLAEVWDEFPLRWKHQLGVSLASKVEAALAGGEGE